VVEAAKVLNNQDAGAQQKRMNGPPSRRRVIDIPEIDPYQVNSTFDEPARKVFL
jgi:hypothetical protein